MKNERPPDNARHIARRMNIIEEGESLEDIELNDSSDDFDLVAPGFNLAEDGAFGELGSPTALFVFDALDGRERTDTWLSNREEAQLNRYVGGIQPQASQFPEVDPWDPDSDDDGLTDGQEVRGLTLYTTDSDLDHATVGSGLITAEQFTGTQSGPAAAPGFSNSNSHRSTKERLFPVATSDAPLFPWTPDSDDDGYWDGWIGVYNVSHSDNVVLYRHNLNEVGDKGIEGEEIVQAQIGTHDASAAPTATSADVDGDSNEEHSNLHIGELQWGTDPGDEASTPDPTVPVDIGYHPSANSAIFKNRAWEQSIAENYALYGIDITFREGQQTIQSGSSPITINEVQDAIPSATDPGGSLRSTRLPIYVANRAYDHSGKPLWNPSQTGIRWYDDNRDDTAFVTVFTPWQESEDLSEVPDDGRSDAEEQQLAAQKTAVHEIGHVLNIGEADDDGTQEIYSGDKGENRDPTPEEILGEKITAVQFERPEEWSVMSSGIEENQFEDPMNGRYFVFSVEEMLTVSVGDSKVTG